MKILLNIFLLLLPAMLLAQETIISVFYYPWYGTNRHWGGTYLRDVLVPQQKPLLGEYSNRNEFTIQKHIEWSETYGIDNWVCSWWGPNSWEDETIRNHIVPQLENKGVTFCLLYEAAGLLGLANDQINFDEAKITTFRNHIKFIAENYFSLPSYQKYQNRPVLYIYLTRTFSGDYKQALELVRQDMRDLGFEIFIVGDEVYWGNPIRTRIATLDAITAYNMHGPHQYAGYPSNTNFLRDVQSQYYKYQSAAKLEGVKFFPKIMPGFNDRAVRLEADHYVITNQVHPDSNHTSTFSHYADLAKNFLDPELQTVCVTSFNEWHEDTQIEPTIETVLTKDDKSAGNDYSQNYFYKGYKFDFLEIIQQKFGNINSSVGTSIKTVPAEFSLLPNYPNPFSSVTTITLKVNSLNDSVSLEIYDITGRFVSRLKAAVFSTGIHKISWDGLSNDGIKVPSGIYFCIAKSENSVQKIKLLHINN